ncbi:hypothetical protein B0H17DRAFT_512602 [Mycena rosella]|uniref:F-box domain-containing protein n=1 Tax=Mycena rosella TaxID=1033263 RepID=A0AAD7DIZ8_MYCRO|nr:hypothetical protein B0H17DRAFT_512602 [Mycena rosella]
MATPCVRCGLSPTTERTTESNHGARDLLRHRLAQLDTLIATLSAERARLQAQSDSIVYPVLCLPPELTSLIFIHCIQSTGDLPHPSPIGAPLLLTQICRQWREIAVNTPELWQSIALVDTRSVEVFKTWLSRSGSLPLSFSLNCVDPIHAASLIDACMPHAHRWQDVELALPARVLKRLDCAAPLLMLRRISLSLRGPFSREGAVDVHRIASSAVLLRQAIVNTYPDLRFDLPWAKLTALTLGRLDDADFFAIVKLCPDLVTLDITTTGGGALPDSDTAPLTLAALESFAFPSDFCSVLPFLLLPRLTHINIRETVFLDADHATALRALIRRSSAAIHRLTLQLKYPVSRTLERCLDAVPASIRVLTLRCGNATKVAPLLAVLRNPDVLPALKTLSIGGGRLFDDDYAEIPALLRERRLSGVLESFALLVETYGRLDAARDLPRIRAMPRFRALAAEGLRIRIAVAGKFRVGTEVLMDTL